MVETVETKYEDIGWSDDEDGDGGERGSDAISVGARQPVKAAESGVETANDHQSETTGVPEPGSVERNASPVPAPTAEATQIDPESMKTSIDETASTMNTNADQTSPVHVQAESTTVISAQQGHSFKEAKLNDFDVMSQDSFGDIKPPTKPVASVEEKPAAKAQVHSLMPPILTLQDWDEWD